MSHGREWREGLVVKLPKKRDLRDCSNHRGFMLLSVPGKVFKCVCVCTWTCMCVYIYVNRACVCVCVHMCACCMWVQRSVSLGERVEWV